MTEARKIGLLGGTFDPIHFGHLRLAEEAMAQLALDDVVFLPDAIPPHKEAEEVTPFSHRLRMTELAVAGEPRYHVSGLEAERAGKSYTYDTLALLQARCPETVYYFLTGADALEKLVSWYRWQDILDLCYFVVASRPGFSLAADDAIIAESNRRSKGLILLFIDDLDISSSAVRDKMQAGLSYQALLPKAVRDYINENNLYRR